MKLDSVQVGLIMRMRESLKPDEKIVFFSGCVPMIIKKNWFDRMISRIFKCDMVKI